MITKHPWIRPLAIASVLALAPPAWGQSAPAATATASVAPMSPEAAAHFEMGTRHYNLQEWADAVKEYKEAYRLAPRPDILWSIAQAQRLGGDHEAAIKSYQAFLRTGPSEKQTALANEAIIKCQSALLEKASAPAPSGEPAKKPEPPAPAASGAPSASPTQSASAAPGPSAPRGPDPWYTDVLGDVLTLGGVAGVVFGGVALGVGNAKATDANAATDYASFDRQRGAGPTLQTAGVIGLAAGGALIATGVVRLVLVARRPAAPATEAASAGVKAGPGGVLVHVSGRF